MDMARLTVNGQPVDYHLDGETPLLWALRDASNLTGTKYGCDSKDCGACTVMVDGEAVLSCSAPLSGLEGAQVTTIEGLGAGGPHPVQQAWLKEQAMMCGSCESGFIMAVAAMIANNPAPDSAAIDALPNKCRCGAYVRIRKAIATAIALSGKAGNAPDAEPGTT